MNVTLQRLADNKPFVAVLFALTAVGAGLVLGLLTGMLDQPLYLAVGMAGLVVGVITFYRIEYGLLALVVLTYTRLSDVLVQTYGIPSVAKLIVPLLLLLVLARWVLFREKPASWRKTAVLLSIYGLVGFASLLYASNFDAALNDFLDYVKDVLIALVVVMILQRGKTLRQVIWALLISGLFLGTLTTIQQLTGTFTNNYWGFATAEIQNIVGETNDYRIAGPLSSNFYALVLVPLVPLALDRLWHEKSNWLRFLAAWALLVITLSIIFTYSRGGFLALVVVVVLMLLRMNLNPWYLLALAVMGLIMWQLLPPQYTERIGTLGSLVGVEEKTAVSVEEASFNGRLSEIIAAWLMFLDHPVQGVGLANYNDNYLAYSQSLGLDQRLEARSAHSLYLEIAAETGLIGLMAFGAILFFAFKDMVIANRRFQAVSRPDYANITAAFAIGLIGYLVGALFLHLAYARYFWLFIGIAMAIPNVARCEYGRLQASHARAAPSLPTVAHES